MSVKIEVFDNSMLQQMKDCPRKFYWRYQRHLKPNFEKDYVPAFGGALHDGLEAWYGSGKQLDAAIKAFTESWLPFEGQDPDGKRCMMRGLTILQQYHQQFQEEPFEVISKEHIEVGFAIEFYRWIICGKMDIMAHWTMLTPGLVAVEHKFSNSKGYLVCEPNSQLDTYIYGGSKITGERFIGALFNQCYHTAKDMTKNDFVRELTYRTPAHLEEWERETRHYLELCESYQKENFWPKNTKHCGAYFRSCEYTRLCRSFDKAEQDSIIAVMYTEDVWNPYPDARGVV